MFDDMRTSSIIIGVVVGALVLCGLYGWSAYNGLVEAQESVKSQWSQVESQYQRRFDLVPNLVEAVKGGMKQEKEIFVQIAEARTRYGSAQGITERAEAADELNGALSRLLVIMEQYPQLKSSDTVATLMSQIEGTENRIAVERQRFNERVESYNVRVKRFPGSIIANMGGFSEITYTKAQAGAEQAPKVSF